MSFFLSIISTRFSYNLFFKHLKDAQPTYLPPIDTSSRWHISNSVQSSSFEASSEFCMPPVIDTQAAFSDVKDEIWNVHESINQIQNKKHSTKNVKWKDKQESIKLLEQIAKMDVHLSDFGHEVNRITLIQDCILISNLIMCENICKLYFYVEDVPRKCFT